MKPSPFLERNEFFSKSFFEASYFHEFVCVGGSAFNNNRFVREEMVAVAFWK